jgi:hypothetical protein
VLDSFYLQIERKYAALYKKVIEPESKIQPLSLNIGDSLILSEPGLKFFDSFFSRTMKGFYISLLVISGICTFFISSSYFGGMPPMELRLNASDTINVKAVGPDPR